MEVKAPAAEKDFSAQFLANRRARKRRRWIAFLVVVAAVGGGYYWMTQQNQVVQEDEDLIVTIGYGDIENAIPASGSLQPKEIVPVGARASGELTEILVEEGDYVEAGQELAKIDAREQALRVESSELSLRNQENQVEQREVALEYALNNYERTQRLYDAAASTEQELENARNNYLNAKTSLDNLLVSIEQSKTNLEQEAVQLDYTTIRAPLSGTIISLDQKEGATLNASQTAPTVMQIADLTTLTVETEISEADVQALTTGVEVYFTTLGSGDRRWYGQLRQIAPMPSVSNNVVLYTGRFDVDNADGELKPGMTTQVFFVTSRADNVLTVPLGALTFTDTPAGGQSGSPRQGGRPDSAEFTAMREQFEANGGQITPEMRQRIDQFRGQGGGGQRGGGGFPGGGGGGFPGGGFPGGGGSFNGGGESESAARATPNLAASIALNEPRSATVEVVLADDSREIREIVVGAMDRVNAEVISGLVEGDRVVAGTVLPDVEEDESDSRNNNNNDWQRQRMMRGFF